MDRTHELPRVAFVINLADAGSNEANDARVHHLVHLFRGHRLPATWAIATPKRATLLQTEQSSVAKNDLALTATADWAGAGVSTIRFRRELIARLVDLHAPSGLAPQLILGDPQTLRPRSALLAENGITGILATPHLRSKTIDPQALPCGLWRLDSSFHLPRLRHWSRWLSARRVSVRHITADASANILVTVDSAALGRISARRGLQGFEKLLREVSWAASRNQLAVSTIPEVLAELTRGREVKPQRSILRVAA